MSGRRSVPPAPLPETDLSRVFEARIAPAYWSPFAARLSLALGGERLAPNAKILELGCATGSLTVELQKLVPAGRVVAIETRRTLLDLAKKRAPELNGRRIFWKEEAGERTTFADGAFDAVVANLPFDRGGDPDAVVGEMRRVAVPGGTVALTLALAGTWSIVLDIYEEVVEKFEFPGAADRLRALAARYPEPEGVPRWLASLGVADIAFEEFSFPIRFRNARELFRDELVLAEPLAAWRAVAGDDTAWERAGFHLRETMDTYFASAEAIEVPVRGGVAVGRAGS